ncbi:alcohol oxidase [Trametopsis cervina]|nr:alcohol oxidase [Trametopsis cervina]
MTAKLEDVAGKTFDYIIVGGGTVGLTLAARLSADPAKSVLVLEAGEAHLNNHDILGVQMYGSHFANDLYAYRHKWVKQAHAADREGVWERGKGLGGSSAINFLGWFRPPGRDIDDFTKLGNPSWTFPHYLSRVNRAEGLVPPPPAIASANGIDVEGWKVGREGPVVLSWPGVVEEGERRIMETFHADGFPKNATPYNGDPSGFYMIPSSRDPKTNTRSYATTAYYTPNASRPNLTVLVTAPVRRVLLSTSLDAAGLRTATGVEFSHAGGAEVFSVNAAKEVLLAAGTLTSPHILEQSGIGRKSVLERVGVPVQVALPGVGENLQEHIYSGVTFELTDDAPLDTLDLLRDPAELTKHLALAPTGQGLFNAGCVGIGFTSLGSLTPRAAEIHADVLKRVEVLSAQVKEEEGKEGEDEVVRRGLLEQWKVLEERYRPGEGEGSPGFEFISFPAFYSFPNFPKPGKRYVTMMLVMNYSLSRGTVHSTSNDPLEAPEIDPHYLSHEVELEMMYEQFQRMRRIASLPPFKDMIATELNPGPEVQSEKEVKEWIRKSFMTIYHTVGSCAMLPKDKGGVVDPELKVYGTANLRVVDIGVIPLHIGANTQSTAYGLGEIAGDIIEGKWPSA